MNEAPKRRGRGPGKKPAMPVTSLRLPRYVMDYFNLAHPQGKQAKIREVLTAYVDQQIKGENHDG